MYRFPMFSTYPVPKDYIPNIGTKSANKQGLSHRITRVINFISRCVLVYALYNSDRLTCTETELSKYLSETKKAKLTLPWLDKCRKAFCSVLTTKPEQARGNGE